MSVPGERISGELAKRKDREGAGRSGTERREDRKSREIAEKRLDTRQKGRERRMMEEQSGNQRGGETRRPAGPSGEDSGTKPARRKSGRKKGTARRIASCLSAAGSLLLILLVLVCLPLTVPKLFGYHIYTVVSGSMEPAISVGSLVYIGETAPGDVAEGEIIAFYGARDSASIITHRVVENRPMMGEFITKGDANPANDMSPVPYENFIGRVVRQIPGAGKAAELFTSTSGKALAGGVIAAAVILQVLAAAIGAGKQKDRR